MGGGQSQPDGTEPELLNFGQNSIEEINELVKTHKKKTMENLIRAYNSKREESKRDNAEHLKRKANRDKLRKEKAADVSDDTDDETLKSMQILPEKSDSEF